MFKTWLNTLHLIECILLYTLPSRVVSITLMATVINGHYNGIDQLSINSYQKAYREQIEIQKNFKS